MTDQATDPLAGPRPRPDVEMVAFAKATAADRNETPSVRQLATDYLRLAASRTPLDPPSEK